jgi:hypothetical protein
MAHWLSLRTFSPSNGRSPSAGPCRWSRSLQRHPVGTPGGLGECAHGATPGARRGGDCPTVDAAPAGGLSGLWPFRARPGCASHPSRRRAMGIAPSGRPRAAQTVADRGGVNRAHRPSLTVVPFNLPIPGGNDHAGDRLDYGCLVRHRRTRTPRCVASRCDAAFETFSRENKISADDLRF